MLSRTVTKFRELRLKVVLSRFRCFSNINGHDRAAIQMKLKQERVEYVQNDASLAVAISIKVTVRLSLTLLVTITKSNASEEVYILKISRTISETNILTLSTWVPKIQASKV